MISHWTRSSLTLLELPTSEPQGLFPPAVSISSALKLQVSAIMPYLFIPSNVCCADIEFRSSSFIAHTLWNKLCSNNRSLNQTISWALWSGGASIVKWAHRARLKQYSHRTYCANRLPYPENRWWWFCTSRQFWMPTEWEMLINYSRSLCLFLCVLHWWRQKHPQRTLLILLNLANGTTSLRVMLILVPPSLFWAITVPTKEIYSPPHWLKSLDTCAWTPGYELSNSFHTFFDPHN